MHAADGGKDFARRAAELCGDALEDADHPGERGAARKQMSPAMRPRAGGNPVE